MQVQQNSMIKIIFFYSRCMTNETAGEIRSEANIYDQTFSTNANKLHTIFKNPSTSTLLSQLSLEFRVPKKNLTLLSKIGEGE